MRRCRQEFSKSLVQVISNAYCCDVLCISRRELSNEYLPFACKSRLRYSEERAVESIKFHTHLGNLVSYSFVYSIPPPQAPRAPRARPRGRSAT